MSFGETEIVVSGYAIKSKWFWHMPDNSWRVPESFWKLFGIFRNKTGNVPELQEPVQMLFADENH